MNYLWKTVLEARKSGIKESKLKYRIVEIYSAYMEIAIEYLNQLELPEHYLIEINPYYRFFEIRVDILIQLFLDIQYVVEIYYEHHFAILGIDDAMIINGMVLR